MANKIVVIALVALIAAPILLGYAMNIQEVTETDYTQGKSTNVTNLISKGNRYTYTSLNSYDINLQYHRDSGTPVPIPNSSMFPNYEVTSTPTSIPYVVFDTPTDVTLADYRYYQLSASFDPNDDGIQLSLRFLRTNDTYTGNYNRVTSLSWNLDTGIATVVAHTKFEGEWHQYENNVGSIVSIEYDLSAFSGTVTVQATPVAGDATTYADPSKGYTTVSDGPYDYDWWVPPSPVSAAAFTIDLSTVTDSVAFRIYPGQKILTLIRTADGDDVTWSLNGNGLIYDAAAAENVYQVVLTRSGAELRYVSTWPTDYGLANSFREWSYEWESPIADDAFIEGVKISAASGDSPKIRADMASAISSTYPAIVNYTYNPSAIIGVPDTATTINSVSHYGSSITFGGNQYDVSNRSLQIGNRSVSLKGITFESHPNGSGSYVNLINGREVSTTSFPSPIIFNGTWNADVVSAPLIEDSRTDTKWVAGGWAWNGLDSNFAIAGLAACLAVFVGLGMYGRRSGAKVGMLMLITGCAALIFLAMI